VTTIKRVTKDFETRSQCPLKKAGAYKYSLDPTTQPTCLAFKISGHPTVYFLDFKMVNTPWEKLPQTLTSLWSRLIEEGYDFSAHNSFFEKCIYDNIMVKRYGWPKINPRKRRCTAAKAAACALPRNLEGAGAAMNLTTQKDKNGYIAMMATCKPTKAWTAWKKLQDRVANGERMTEKSRLKAKQPEPKMFLDYEDDPQTWETLYRYCKIDVKTEELLDASLPDLSPEEQQVWFLNQQINWRGLRVDINTVKKIVGMIEAEKGVKLKELDKLTMGLVTKPGARKSILEFLALEGIELPDLKAKTVEDKLSGFELSQDMHRLLEIRKALTMTSTKKYYSFLDRATEDSRIRDLLLYHGASTGRETGTGVQPHNFPKGLIKINKDRPYAHVENIVDCDPEMLKILYGDSLSMLFSALLRNMILPSEGCDMFVGDFAKIEVAVLWWLADNWAGLKVLNNGLDPYIYQAAENMGVDYEEIEKEGKDRDLGKAQVLGCGFGMGAKKFRATAKDFYGLSLTLKESKRAVANYRKANSAVPDLWQAYEHAGINAIKTGKTVRAGKCIFKVEQNFLWVTLPSGRRLAYKDPKVTWRVREYEETKEIENKDGTITEVTVTKVTEPLETLEFMAVDSKTKKWGPERTWGGVLTENITQATARDLLMPAMLRLEKAGYKVLLSVHDEIICEKPKREGNLKEFLDLMCVKPSWADEYLPVEAKGWMGPRYRK